MYLLDTNIISFIIEKDEKSLNIQNHLKDKIIKLNRSDILFYSVISYQETKYGIEDAKSKYSKEYKKDKFADTLSLVENENVIKIINYNKDMASRFAQISSKLNRLGKPIEEYDIMIAATAIEAGFILITNNTKDFKNIPNLAIEDWTQPL